MGSFDNDAGVEDTAPTGTAPPRKISRRRLIRRSAEVGGGVAVALGTLWTVPQVSSYAGAKHVQGSPPPGFHSRLTPGYWKNHMTDGNPKTIDFLPQCLGAPCPNGPYVVDTTTKATAVFAAMNCGSSSSQNAIGCLAGHLLAAKLNLANGSNPCNAIVAAVAAADTLLKNPPPPLPYIGPMGNYSSLDATRRSQAISVKNTLDSYNNGGVC